MATGVRCVLILQLLLLLLVAATGVSSRTTYTGSSAAGEGTAPAKPKKMVPALVVFGDSIMDPGNNNAIHTIVKANFPPYGHDFGPDHRPTGRFSNGKIPTDFLASRLGLKDLLPAYLAPDLTSHDLLTGVSFASGGTGYDPLTAQLASAISMTDQLRMFDDYKQKVRAAAGDAALSDILAKGIFVVCTGSNDVTNTYFTLRARSSYSHASYASFVVAHAAAFLDGLLSAGARHVAVISLPPVGCMPSQRTLSGGMARDCSPGPNEIAEMVNAGMGSAVDSLKANNPGAKVVLVDMYGFFMDMMARPQGYGFRESTLGCCGTGMMEVSVLCNGVTSAVCGVIADYLFWDSYHPTEKAYGILVDFVYDEYLQKLIE
ncbi:GDSL esterase/lipase EXL3-like [Triticum dicoccoides]|uniref:GDSL esterase/lipase EXL3-like n=1 Tax=Triticum dicoccoides TaxID=85692 RepID=UPI000E790A23|nr:GDSL esterase/lipase EXL3-like [Triticum dicoccoides]